MKIREFFKGRFGSFYLIKVWACTIIIGPILAGLLGLIFIPDALNELSFEFITFILLEIIYGFVLSLPSLILSEIIYIILNQTKLQNPKILAIIVLLSLVLTNITYFWFLNNGSEKVYLYIFSVSYSLIMICSFFYFYKRFRESNFIGN